MADVVTADATKLELIYNQNKESLKRFDDFEARINSKMGNIKEDVSSIQNNTNSVIESQQSISELYEEQKDQNKKNKNTIENLERDQEKHNELEHLTVNNAATLLRKSTGTN